jgi:hypothetical protein
METSEQLKEERDKIVKGLEIAYRKLVLFKKLINSPMIVMKDGKIVALPPDQIPPTVEYKRG